MQECIARNRMLEKAGHMACSQNHCPGVQKKKKKGALIALIGIVKSTWKLRTPNSQSQCALASKTRPGISPDQLLCICDGSKASKAREVREKVWEAKEEIEEEKQRDGGQAPQEGNQNGRTANNSTTTAAWKKEGLAIKPAEAQMKVGSVTAVHAAVLPLEEYTVRDPMAWRGR